MLSTPLYYSTASFAALPLGLANAVYHDTSVPIWIAHHGHDYPGQSMYFMSSDGERFHELIQTGVDRAISPRVISFEKTTVILQQGRARYLFARRRRIETNRYRLELGDGEHRFFEETDVGEVLLSGALSLLGDEEALRILEQASYSIYNRQRMADRGRLGGLRLVLACGIGKRWGEYALHSLNEGEAADVVEGASDDERRIAALCILGESSKHGDLGKVLVQFETSRLAPAARYYKEPMHILWQRAKDGDAEALEAIRLLALDYDEAVRKLLSLYCSRKVAGAREALLTVPIEGRAFYTWMFKDFDDAGHPDAKRILKEMDPKGFIDQVVRQRWVRDIANCSGLNDLGTLVRYGNQGALEGLLNLHADGHYAARLMLKRLVDEEFISKGVLKAVDLTPLEMRAHEDPMAVIALHNLHEDGHPDALKVLEELEPVDGLLAKASTNYNAIGAIYYLDAAGNAAVREGINSVSIEQWRERYNWRGQGKLDAWEARDAMSILARLGNEEACRHEGVAVPRRAMAALKTLQAVEELRAQGHDVKVVASAAPSIAEEGDAVTSVEMSNVEDDLIN